MNHTKSSISAFATFSIALMPLWAHAVTAPNWQSPPAACLPERAARWDNSKSESNQAACHCPPTSHCPTTSGITSIQDWYNASTMPSVLTYQCCPAPTCPPGTELAGKPMPPTGSCGVIPSSPQQDCEDKYKVGFPRQYWGKTQTYDQWLASCTYTEYSMEQGYYTAWVYKRECDHWAWIDVSDKSSDEYPGVCVWHYWQNPGSCLSADSQVTKLDGSVLPLSEVKIGDKLKGPNGPAVVKATNHYDDKASHFYKINDFKFAITGNHPLKTTQGWKVVEPEEGDTTYGRLALGDVLETKTGPVTITTVAADSARDGKTTVNLSTLGDLPFYVDGVAVKPFQGVKFTYPVQGE